MAAAVREALVRIVQTRMQGTTDELDPEAQLAQARRNGAPVLDGVDVEGSQAAQQDNSPQTDGVFLQTLLVIPTTLVLAFLLLHSEGDDPICQALTDNLAIGASCVLIVNILCCWWVRLTKESNWKEVAKVAAVICMLAVLVIAVGGPLLLVQPRPCEPNGNVFTLTVLLIGYAWCFLLHPIPEFVLLLPAFCALAPLVDMGEEKGASQKTINSLEVVVVTPEEESLGEEECPICLNPFEPGQELRVLPCDGRHHFHKECCDEWLTRNAACPLCRVHLPAAPSKLTKKDDNEPRGPAESSSSDL